MKCCDCDNDLWDFSDGETDGGLRLDIEKHLASCSVCREELKSINAMKISLNNPAGFDIDRVKERVLAKVILAQPAPVVAELKFKKSKPKPRLANWLAGAGLAAAFVVAFMIGLLPSSTAALSLDDLLTWHMQCLKNGTDKNYTCKTQMELDKKILRNMGMEPHPFDITHHTGFVKGDICIINGSMASHALFELNGEKIVSHFHVKDRAGKLKDYKGLKKLDKKLYSLSTKDYQILLREMDPGYFEVYIAKTPLESLLHFVKADHT